MPATIPSSIKSVSISQAVQSGLCQFAFQVFTTKAGAGTRLDGALMGRDGEIRSFLQPTEKNTDPTLEKLGHCSVRRRLRLDWDPADDRFLPDDGLFMVVAPGTCNRAEALLWRRREPGAEPVAERISLRSDVKVPIRFVRSSDSTPLVRTPARNSIAPRPRKWALPLSATILVGLFALWLVPPLSPPVQKSADALPALNLQLDSVAADGLHLRWRESGPPPMPPLEAATLLVRQGDQEQTVDLSDRYNPQGSYVLSPSARDVVIRLRVHRAGLPVLERTLTYIAPPPQPKPAVRVAAASSLIAGAPAPVDVKPNTELEQLRHRNQELEVALRALRARLEAAQDKKKLPIDQ